MDKATRKGATLDQIVATVRKEHPGAIKAETDALIDIAMRTIANQYGNLHPGSSSNVQLEFFAEYAVSESVMIPMPDKDGVPRSMRLRVDHLTLDQAREYVDAHQRKPKRSKRIVAMERIIHDLSPFDAGNSTIGECWKASKATSDLIARH
jgi:hypothetical protein